MKDNARTIKYDSITSYAKEYGVEYLSNENLIASIIGIDPMLQGNEPIRKIFDGSHSLRKASKRTLQELTSIKGIGKKKATAILAAFEIGKRLMKEKSEEREDLGSSISIYQHMLPYMIDLEHEEFWVLLMNQNFKLIKKVRMSVGGVTDCAVDVRMIIKEVVLNNATILAVCHNHPSCSPSPSKNDDLLTIQISKACEIMRIFFMDHVIITDGAFYSYHDKGRI
jgi:DNA repair protein RadC